MAATIKNTLNFTQDNTPFFVVPITVNGVVQDLTGWKAFFTMTSVANPSDDSQESMSLSTTLDSTAIARVQTTETQTAAMQANVQYYWDVKIKDPTGAYFSTIVSGTATISQSYTRRTS